MSVTYLEPISGARQIIEPEELLLSNLSVSAAPSSAIEQYHWTTRGGDKFFRWSMALLLLAAIAVIVVAAVTASQLRSDPSYSSTPAMRSATTNCEVLALLGGLLAIFSGVILVADFYRKK